MKTQRYINGYLGIYKPDHPSSYKNNGNWDGWIYEHRFIAEQLLGRPLRDGEVVHHLDCNKDNNNPENIVVLAGRGCHMRLHNWIDAGSPTHDSYVKKSVPNYGMSKPLCKMCDKPVSEHRGEYCSNECRGLDHRKTDRPSQEELIKLLNNYSYVKVGKFFGVSDNAVRKWVKSYGLDPKTLQQLTQDI
jgi:transposase-like protein